MIQTLHQHDINTSLTLHLDFGCKRLHDDVLHISKKPLRGELKGMSTELCHAALPGTAGG